MTWCRGGKTVCTWNMYYDINLCSYVTYAFENYDFITYTMISSTLFIWCTYFENYDFTCIKYKRSMITWDFNHIIWQKYYYIDNIIRQVILKELKEFRKSPTFSFEKVLLKLCQGFEVVFSLTWYFLSSILATFYLNKLQEKVQRNILRFET